MSRYQPSQGAIVLLTYEIVMRIDASLEMLAETRVPDTVA